MWEILGQSFLLFLAVYGVADLVCRYICRCWFSSFHGGYFVIPFKNDGCTEYAARHARLLRHFLLCGDARIVVVGNDTATEMTQHLCQRLQVELVTEEEWKKMTETTLQDEKRGV